MKYIVDFEGFTVNSYFVVKEFVLLSLDSGFKHHFILKSPKTISFRFKDRKNILYCENFLHGIRWSTRGKSFGFLKQFLNSILSSEDTLFIKGDEKVRIFCKQLNPPCQVKDINELFSYAEISQDWGLLAREHLKVNGSRCPLYFHKNNVHCSFTKVEVFSQLMKPILDIK